MVYKINYNNLRYYFYFLVNQRIMIFRNTNFLKKEFIEENNVRSKIKLKENFEALYRCLGK